MMKRNHTPPPLPAADGQEQTSELFAALREMVAHADIGIINRPALRRAHAALAKASGQHSMQDCERRL